MLSDLLFLTLGCGLGACVMKIAVDYKDKHLRRETAKTEHYRAQYEKTRGNPRLLPGKRTSPCCNSK